MAVDGLPPQKFTLYFDLAEFLKTDHQHEVATRAIAYINGSDTWEKYWVDRRNRVDRPPSLNFKGEYNYFFSGHEAWITPILKAKEEKELREKQRLETIKEEWERKQEDNRRKYGELSDEEKAKTWQKLDRTDDGITYTNTLLTNVNSAFDELSDDHQRIILLYPKHVQDRSSWG